MIGRVGVVVLGMSRSGTSAVAGMFVRAGFFAGREGDVLPPSDSNVAGHHENRGVVEINMQVLNELGGSWQNPPLREAQLAAADKMVPRLRDEFERIVSESGGKPIVIKDPRIGVMLPLWDCVLADRLHAVLVVRNPIEISRSLLQRDHTPLPFGLAMWELHTRLLLDYISERPVTVAPYTSLLEDAPVAERIVAIATSHLDPSRADQVEPRNAAEALEPGLRHNRPGVRDELELLTSRQRELWQLLDALPPGDQRVSVPEHLRGGTDNVDAVVGREIERLVLGEERRRLSDEVQALRVRSADLEGRLAETEARLAAHVAEYEQLATRFNELHRDHLVLVNSRRWRIMGPPARVVEAVRRITRRRAR